MFLDGALGSRTAWMRAPYEHSTDTGVEVLSESDFREAVTRAAQHGISSVVHAIGDAAVTRALTVLVASMKAAVLALPHRVEHVQCLPADCASLLGQRVVCSVQPSHMMTDWRAADEHWGAQRANATYAFRFMLENGAVLACGSDAPVEAADPRHGLFAAVTRTDLQGEPLHGWHAEQQISAREALTAYTTGPAYAAGTATARAGLAPGALADFVAWSSDPLTIAPSALLELQPVATVVDGQIVYES
jgi:predicted amidohydrolase YtcJ